MISACIACLDHLHPSYGQALAPVNNKLYLVHNDPTCYKHSAGRHLTPIKKDYLVLKSNNPVTGNYILIVPKEIS